MDDRCIFRALGNMFDCQLQGPGNIVLIRLTKIQFKQERNWNESVKMAAFLPQKKVSHYQ